jgi:uncharacterized membrane protein
MTDVDALCAKYLEQLDAALRDRSVPQRQQIVEQVTEHLNDARAELTVQSEAAVRSILERLGSPDAIAAAAAAGDDAERPRAPWYKRRNGISVLAGAAVLVALGLTLGLLNVHDTTPAGTTIGRLHTTTTTTTTTTTLSVIGTVTVPVVLGESISQATVAIGASGLTVFGIEGNPNGPVVSQDPVGDSRVPSGSAITLHTQVASAS